MNTPNKSSFLDVGDSSERERMLAREELPSWLSDLLDSDLERLWRLFKAEYTDRYSGFFPEQVHRQVRLSESESAHDELPAALARELDTPIPALIPNGARRYFEVFLLRVKEQILALENNEPIPDWMKEALDAESTFHPPERPSTDTHSIALPERNNEKVVMNESEHPRWLDNLLQEQAFPPVPNGANAYFASFRDDVKDTIHRIEVLEELEKREPDTIERLVESPDWFDLTLQDDTHMSLPVGQELFFDDFSERVRSRVAERNLDQPALTARMYVLRKRASWAAAACFGFLVGFLVSYL